MKSIPKPITPLSTQRLVDQDGQFKTFDEVRLYREQDNKSSCIHATFNGISIDEVDGQKMYLIHLGRILLARNFITVE